jgi:hypothetical protein
MTNQPETSNKKAYRFFRSHLSTKVWDPEKNKLMADFSQGTFTTEDPNVAKVLKDMGYPQIPLDSETPPDIIVQQPNMVIEGDVPVLGRGVSEGLGEATMSSRMKTTGGPKAPVVIKRET